MNIIKNDLLREYKKYEKEYDDAIKQTMNSGWYILGNNLKSFENLYATYCGCKHCIGVASGLDALWIAMHMLGIGAGDEVIVQANAYIASVMGITINGALPVFVEPDEYYGIDASKIEEKISSKTKAILVVHLYGNPCNMDKVTEICKKHELYLVEDCAQSHGATYNGKMTGSFGDLGCFSFYPTKNLGAFGDGGCIVCDSDKLDDSIRIFRNYGSKEKNQNVVVGTNSRLDELQAALLKVKLNHLEEITNERIDIARKYNEGIRNSKIILPKERPGGKCVYHQYAIRTDEGKTRDSLVEYLKENGIHTMIHYPIPPHLSDAYDYLGYKKGSFPIAETYADTVLSIPIFNGFTDEEQKVVIDVINNF